MEIGDQTKQDASVQEPIPFVGVFTRDSALVAGQQAVVGVGFTPSVVIFLSNLSSTPQASWGFDRGGIRKSIYDSHNGTPDEYETSGGSSVIMVQAGAISYLGRILTMDTDGFTMDWTKTGAKTGVFSVNFLAFK